MAKNAEEKKWNPFKDIKALIQATKDCVGDMDLNENGDCHSCGKEIAEVEDEDPAFGLCQNKNCRAVVLRRLCTRLAKKYGFKEPEMNADKYDFPKS